MRLQFFSQPEREAPEKKKNENKNADDARSNSDPADQAPAMLVLKHGA